ACAQPGLVKLPTFTDFPQHLRLRYAAILEHQLARLRSRDGGDTAHNAITGRAPLNQKTGHAFAPFGSRQPGKKLHEIRYVGKGRKHLRPVDNKVVAVGSRGGLQHRRIGARGRLAQPKGGSLLSANARPEEPVDLLAFAVVENVRHVIAELKGNRAFFQLFGYRNHRDIADLEAAIGFGHVEMPEGGGFRPSLQALHDLDVTVDFGIAAEPRPAFPAAALEDIRSICKFGLQWNEFVPNKLLDPFSQTLLFF